ncbi:hypothetical protein DFJ74DRAFT_773813 [Hyaloraphidium curvatum]|nr:hypothetical protein DFJ74DRAFT_773813 [Hyaloraphidium curvatum]
MPSALPLAALLAALLSAANGASALFLQTEVRFYGGAICRQDVLSVSNSVMTVASVPSCPAGVPDSNLLADCRQVVVNGTTYRSLTWCSRYSSWPVYGRVLGLTIPLPLADYGTLDVEARYDYPDGTRCMSPLKPTAAGLIGARPPPVCGELPGSGTRLYGCGKLANHPLLLPAPAKKRTTSKRRTTTKKKATTRKRTSTRKRATTKKAAATSRR